MKIKLTKKLSGVLLSMAMLLSMSVFAMAEDTAAPADTSAPAVADTVYDTGTVAGDVYDPSVPGIQINGAAVVFPDTPPCIDAQGRILVPVRFVSENLGAEVTWDGSTNTATIVKDDLTVKFTTAVKTYTVNDEAKEMDTTAVNVEGRVLVPVRYVSEALGATVEWDAATKTADITLQ